MNKKEQDQIYELILKHIPPEKREDVKDTLMLMCKGAVAAFVTDKVVLPKEVFSASIKAIFATNPIERKLSIETFRSFLISCEEYLMKNGMKRITKIPIDPI